MIVLGNTFQKTPDSTSRDTIRFQREDVSVDQIEVFNSLWGKWQKWASMAELSRAPFLGRLAQGGRMKVAAEVWLLNLEGKGAPSLGEVEELVIQDADMVPGTKHPSAETNQNMWVKKQWEN